MDMLTDEIDSTVQYLMVQQNYSGLHAPEEKSGFEIVDNTFIATPVKIAGYTIANSPPGYQYALYKRRLKIDKQ